MRKSESQMTFPIRNLSRNAWKLAVTLAFALMAARPSPGAEAPAKRSPDEVLLVCNERSRVSKAVAADYAEKRGIRHRLSIRCVDSAVNADNETVSLDVYREAIEGPVSAYLAAHPEVQFIVLTKGIPLRISGADTGERPDNSPPDTPLSTSVDSHLAALGYAALHGVRKLSITGSARPAPAG